MLLSLPMAPTLRVRAVNTAAESDNRIHDDRVAAEYGFRGGLVPGVTVYGYMASAAIAHFGPAWLERGAMDVRFYQPFYDGEEVAVSTYVDDARIILDAGGRASGMAWIDQNAFPTVYPEEHSLSEAVVASRETVRAGFILGTIEKTLDLSSPQMSAPLEAHIGSERLAHPAILLALANEILVRNFKLGPWIHSSSEVRNFGKARDGETLQVRAKIEEAYERKGHEIAVLDVAILSGERLVTRVRHTAIWQPRKL